MKELNGSTEEKPLYDIRKVKINFTCDLDNIVFIDYTFKQSGEPYKTKCTITHSIKGDIIVDHKYEEVQKIIKDKFKNAYVTIRGYRK